MKKMISLYTSYMIRPTIYKAVTKCVVMLTLLLLWDRYVNEGMLSLVRDGFFLAGVCFLGLAWISYLRLDGVKNPLTGGKKQEKKKKRRLTGDIADYAGQHIVSFEELDDEERLACSMGSSLAAALLFLIPALVMLAL